MRLRARPQVTLDTLKVPDRDAERDLVDAINDGSPECVRRAAAARTAPETPRAESAALPPPRAPRSTLRDVVRCLRNKLEQPDPHVQLLALQARAPRARHTA